ncbi:amidohydrolase [Nonomuraea jabiensis]|uniref:Hippurate hydrolase n=1 Tax=Nonomuraea jabiensis TaxID=882448 RepID=A0A7W9G4L4_9ACTN|nr:amidohydrolase [Nonomuraea jabiensis]MBB5777018.1 hippurate hydrolase [Nonomuraea jabiensis]
MTAELRDLAIFRADLHAHPELSWQEARTADRLAGRLAAAGYEVTTGVGGHGVVGRLCRGDGVTVMLRAELDALPVKEETGLSYASTATATTPDGRTVPVSHACGHDLHLACLAGAARRLAACDDWRGTVLVVGQPAEETLEGAAAMLADGLYERFGVPDVALAQHVSPFPAGLIAYPQPPTAAGAELRVVVTGDGGHAGDIGWAGQVGQAGDVGRDVGRNPVVAVAALVHRLDQTAFDQAVVTVGTLHAGERPNVIPTLAEAGITVRAATVEAVTRAVARVARLAEETAGAGVIVVSRVPPGVNDPTATALVRRAHEAALGTVVTAPGGSACEDFPLYGVPSVYWYVGAAPPTGQVGRPHTGTFRPDPVPTLRAGVTAMQTAALAVLANASQSAPPSRYHGPGAVAEH